MIFTFILTSTGISPEAFGLRWNSINSLSFGLISTSGRWHLLHLLFPFNLFPFVIMNEVFKSLFLFLFFL